VEENKFDIQDKAYHFPFHHIPYFDDNKNVRLSRKLYWGLEYLCYQKHIAEKILSYRPVSILDVGCGDGRLLHFISETGNNSVCGSDGEIKKAGVDLSKKAISFARAFNPDCNIYCCDIKEITDTFDAVTAIEVLEHIPDNYIGNFLSELQKHLNPKGRIIICVPTTVVPVTRKHYRHYTIELLSKCLSENNIHLKIISFEYIFHRPWWLKAFRRLEYNGLFSLEIKPLTQFVWKKIWNKYRFANENNGTHLVCVLQNS
jgi:2-polyprenyl-3-methyl-5-hydroxy-6-metoxy-1,4-benzoquinol methylase